MALSEEAIEVLEIPGFSFPSKLREGVKCCDLISELNECWALIHKHNQKTTPQSPAKHGTEVPKLLRCQLHFLLRAMGPTNPLDSVTLHL